MDPLVFAAVLFAAACHAGWNAAIKRGLDPLATTVLISIGAAVVSALCLPVVGLPAPAAWPWCAASVAIHLVYFAALLDRDRDHGFPWRAARPCRLVRHHPAGRRGDPAVAPRRPRFGEARSQGCRFR